MSDYEREAGKRLVDAIEKLPPDKREFFLGYCRAVSDLADDPGAEPSSA